MMRAFSRARVWPLGGQKKEPVAILRKVLTARKQYSSVRIPQTTRICLNRAYMARRVEKKITTFVSVWDFRRRGEKQTCVGANQNKSIEHMQASLNW